MSIERDKTLARRGCDIQKRLKLLLEEVVSPEGLRLWLGEAMSLERSYICCPSTGTKTLAKEGFISSRRVKLLLGEFTSFERDESYW